MARLLEDDLARLNLTQHSVDERRFDPHALLGNDPCVVLLHRPQNRGTSGFGLKMFDPDECVEQAGDARLQPVEPGHRVFANRDEEPGLQIALRDRARQFVGKRPRSTLVRVIEKVLLELIENDEQVGIGRFRSLPHHVRQGLSPRQVQRSARESLGRGLDRLRQGD